MQNNGSIVLEIDGTPSDNNAVAIDDTEFSNCRATVPPTLE